MEVGIRTVDKANPWRFDPQRLSQLIADRWPQATFKPASKATSLRFYISLPESPGKGLDGFLTSNQKGVAIEGHESDCVAFVLWLRSLVSPNVRLGLADDYHGAFLELTPNTSELDVLEFWHSKP